MKRYRFALRPKWIFGHVIVLSMVIGFTFAGFWQLHRLHERRAFNAEVLHNYEQPVSDVARVVSPGATSAQADATIDRRVRATGRYLSSREVVITGQANATGDPGVWLVTPLQLSDGSIVLVNRGWVSSTGNISSAPVFARPPSGEVTVSGTLSQTQLPGPGESKDPSTGTLTSMMRVNVARLSQQLPAPTLPVFIQLSSQSPAGTARVTPTPLQPLAINDGPHLGYAEQWFAFTLLALIAYPILLWKVAGDREKEDRSKGDDGDPYGGLPEGAFVDEDGVIDLTGVGAGSGNRSG